MRLKLGDTLTFNILGREITATIANFREIDWSTLRMNFATVFSPGVLDAAPKTYLGTLRTEEQSETTIVRLLGERFPNVSAVRVRDTLNEVARLLTQIMRVILLAAAFSLLSGTLVMAGAIMAGLERRRYDTVMLKVVGASPALVLRIFVVEFLLVAVMTSLIATVLGIAGAYGVMQLMVFSHLSINPLIIVATLALSIAISLIVGLSLTRRALAVRPLQLLRNE